MAMVPLATSVKEPVPVMLLFPQYNVAPLFIVQLPLTDVFPDSDAMPVFEKVRLL